MPSFHSLGLGCQRGFATPSWRELLARAVGLLQARMRTPGVCQTKLAAGCNWILSAQHFACALFFLATQSLTSPCPYESS